MMIIQKYKIIDLSMPLNYRTPGLFRPLWAATHWHGPVEGPAENLLDVNGDPTCLRWHLSMIVLGTHVGTHTDVPYHRLQNGSKLYEMQLENWVGRAVCLDISPKGYRQLITPEELKRAEEEAEADIYGGDIVLVRTGWSQKYMENEIEAEAYSSKSPGMSVEAAKWLVKKGIKTVGVDFYSLDLEPTDWKSYVDMTSTPAHVTLFEEEIPIVENLVNLESLVGREVFFIGLPLKLQLVPDGSPIRAIALVGE